MAGGFGAFGGSLVISSTYALLTGFRFPLPFIINESIGIVCVTIAILLYATEKKQKTEQ